LSFLRNRLRISLRNRPVELLPDLRRQAGTAGAILSALGQKREQEPDRGRFALRSTAYQVSGNGSEAVARRGAGERVGRQGKQLFQFRLHEAFHRAPRPRPPARIARQPLPIPRMHRRFAVADFVGHGASPSVMFDRPR
jgi:hypothetical protein